MESSRNSPRANIFAPSFPSSAKRLRTPARPTKRIDAIAVTQGPGLAGALLVGLSYAKAPRLRARKAAHRRQPSRRTHPRRAARRAPERPARSRSFRCSLWWSAAATPTSTWRSRNDGGWTYRNIGHTRDDAAGEAFDKVAKLLELGYPGGPVIDFLAQHGNPHAVKFPFAQIKHRDRNPQNRHAADERRIDFSYSGIKTAVLRYVEVHNMAESIQRRRESMTSDRQARAAGLPRSMRSADTRSGRLISARDGERPGQQDSGRSDRVRRRNSAGDRRRRRQQRIAAQPSKRVLQKKEFRFSSPRASSPPTTPP